MNIDDLADDVTDRKSPGEQFRDQWLEDLPVSQWPAYIDESAQLVADGILIGETDLTSGDFAVETGRYYREGLATSTDIDLNETSLPLGQHSATDIGRVAWTFNHLREEIRKSQYTDFTNPSRAIEAVINKALVESIQRGDITAEDLEMIRLPESATVSTLVSEVFCRPRSETYVELLLDTVRERATSSLLERLDEPRMVTPLWEHQQEALDRWLAHGCRGYVDMATATGKTVLGLAAIAHHYGALHPADREITEQRYQHGSESRATVIILAHRGLILDQWKREFDTHLNIPEEQQTQDGEHTVEFEWGDVHFWTPKRLQETGIPDADLVILDETHHYLGDSGFGGILDHFENHILALSGSLDESNARTLERRNIPKIFEFSLRDGQQAGIIPHCDWDVTITPYENQSQLAEVTARCCRGIDTYSDGIELPDTDAVDDYDRDLGFVNLSEARSLIQSTVGREIKERDPDFREFASAIQARQMTKYNLSPTLSTVVRITLDHIDQHKCVVLLESKDEIARVTDELEAQLGEAYSSLVTVLEDGADLQTIEDFDHNQEHGAIIGIAKTLGEGVDIETADICINRGRGRLSRSLIQRMGRILRNPDGDKQAKFFHVLAIPTLEKATLQDEDGVALLETASQLLSWGEKFSARPVFEVDTETTMTEQRLLDLERAGSEAIADWLPEHYEWPADENVRTHLESLRTRLNESDGSALLSLDRQESEPSQVGSTDEDDNDALTRSDRFVAADGDPTMLPRWLYRLVDVAADDVGQDPKALIEQCVRSYAREALSFPSDTDLPSDNTTKAISLNPALDALLAAYTEEGSKQATVHMAVVHRLVEELDVRDLVKRADIDVSSEVLSKHVDTVNDGY